MDGASLAGLLQGDDRASPLRRRAQASVRHARLSPTAGLRIPTVGITGQTRRRLEALGYVE